MPIFDVEPVQTLSRSYVDHVMSGNMIQSFRRIGTSTTVVTGNRVELGSHVSGVLGNYIRTLTEYGEYVNAVSGGYRPERHAGTRMVTLLQPGARYFDTVMPSINDIMTTDCLGITLVNVPNGTGLSALSFVAILGVSSSGIQYEMTESVVTQQAHGEKLSNNSWLFSYPFEYKYRNAKRAPDFLTQISQIKYIASSAMVAGTDGLPWSCGFMSGANVRPKAATEFSPNASDPFWALGTSYDLTSVSRFSIGYIVPKNDAKIVTKEKLMILFSTGGIVTSAGHFSPGVTRFYGFPNISASLQPKPPSDADIIKHFFGFGDGLNHSVEFGTPHSSSWSGGADFDGQTPHRIGYGSKIRGWKFGIMNGFEVNPKCIFRRDHFGHFRDMLEQRQYSKLLDKSNNTTDSPISCIFISGSGLAPGVDAYTTATFKPSENTSDSGIYNREYACGQPWRDR